MKKLVNLLKKPVVAAGVFGLVVASGTASANFGDFKFYAGAGVDYSNYKKSSSDLGTLKANGVGVVVPVLGIKFHENFGLEAGYSFGKKLKYTQNNIEGSNINGNWNVKVRNVYLDLMGFVPVADQFELIGGIGLGRLMFKGDNINFTNVPAGANISSSVNYKNKTSWRVKLGAQYNFTNNFGVRALATYQNVTSKANVNINANNGAVHYSESSTGKIVKNDKTIGLAAVYTF